MYIVFYVKDMEAIMSNETKKGGISVETGHIFPIIKKWLYSDKDIFLREIVSNASDAVTKYKRLISLGETSDTEAAFRIDVKLDKDAGTLTVSDNGIGMTEEELEKYICNIALSGALEFIQKYEGQDNAGNGIIGHFGLGFYSSFMVSDKVEILTKSYTGAPAVHWVCNEAGEYEIEAADKEDCGTDIIMHINEGEEYLDESKLRAILNKYCAFMPIEIYLNDEEKPINETAPLWLKPTSECTADDYKNFYHKVFEDPRDPLFWIHINADYPLNFKGILYFPRMRNEYDSVEGQVKLYYNQVFVADNIKEVIPEYLLMLKGVLDCPELPLNVSRSYLQDNTYVAKVAAHIVKKVADKLGALLNNDRAEYEKVWDDIRTFIEYACLRDRKFYDRVKNALLLHITDGSYMTTEEYLEAAKDTNENKVYYATDKRLQSQYISLLNSAGIKVALMEHVIDTQFSAMLEDLSDGIKYLRVDADIADALKSEGNCEEIGSLKELFKKVSGNENLMISFERLKDESVPAIMSVSEESRRMEEAMRLYAMQTGNVDMTFPVETSFVINTASELIGRLEKEENADKAEKIASYIYKLALLSQKHLSGEEMQSFLTDGYELLSMLF